jgi:hypothetical protein
MMDEHFSLMLRNVRNHPPNNTSHPTGHIFSNSPLRISNLLSFVVFSISVYYSNSKLTVATHSTINSEKLATVIT